MAAPANDQAGQVINGPKEDYHLLELAGQGGMATVWRAMTLGRRGPRRPVAIKRILPELMASPDFVAMFVEEGRVGSQLVHPNVVAIEEFATDAQGAYFLAMEWVEGIDLLRLTRALGQARQAVPWPLVAAVGAEVARGLGSAHERVDAAGRPLPVYHRDVSPQNILVSVAGAVKVTDFGLARASDRDSMTRPNMIKGKLAYLAPELIAGASASVLSDIYGLGIVMWETLAGRKLFDGKGDLQVLLAVRDGVVPPLVELRTDLPASMARIVHTALAKQPAQRFASMRQLGQALTNLLGFAPEPVDAAWIGRQVEHARLILASGGGA
jgi:serine/threonine-protein kinase